MQVSAIMVHFVVIVLLLCPVVLGDNSSALFENRWEHFLRPWKPLFEAARIGDLQKAENEIKNGIDVNIKGGNTTALHVAAANGHVRLVKFLLNKNVSVDLRDFEGKSPLQIAAESGRKEVAEVLIHNGANVNAVDRKNRTPVYSATRYRHENVVKLLVQYGADVNIADVYDWTPLHDAVYESHFHFKEDISKAYQIADILIQHGSNVSAETRKGQMPLHIAAAFGSVSLVELLLNNGAPVNSKAFDGSTPLHGAIAQGETKVIEELLRHGADINAVDNDHLTPIYKAISNGNGEVVELLIQHGAKANAGNETNTKLLLSAALWSDDDRIIETLLQNGADPNANPQNVKKNSPLYEAAENGNVRFVELLLNYGASVYMENFEGKTPLDIAIAKRNKKITDLLTSKLQ